MLVDSNILIYAINRSSDNHKQAQDFLQQAKTELILAPQNILGTLRILTHPKFSHPMKVDQAIKAIMRIAENCRLITPDMMSTGLALELINKHRLSGNKIFDAYLTATAVSANVKVIATNNVADFRQFGLIDVVNPFDTGKM